MATEDERYRQSSQYRLWSYTPSDLRVLRDKTNALAKQQIAPRLATDASDFLTADDESQLVKFFTVELLRAGEFCNISTEVRATAAIFLRRFYVTNSVMTYPPTELLKTCLFFACKADVFYYPLAALADKFPNTTGEQILAGEFLLCQGMRFAFDVRHPFRALEGAVLELRRRLGQGGEDRINHAHKQTREILKFSPLVTDVYFHYAPSQVMMAALSIVDAGLVDLLVPGDDMDATGHNDAEPTAEHTDIRKRIFGAIEKCRDMLMQEPPERMTEFWGKPEAVKMIKPLRRKLQRCRDPDRADLVALQRARREMAAKKDKKPGLEDDSAVFGDGDPRDTKRRKVESEDVFGPAL